MGGGRLLEHEALVVVVGDLVAFLAVGADAAGVGHEDAGFAGDVGAEVPGIGEHKESGFGDFVDVGDPGLLSLRIGFGGLDSMFAHPGDEVGDEVDVLLDADGHVAEDGGASGAGDHEHVGEAGDLEAEVGLGAVGPFLAQREPVAAADVHPEKAAGHAIEAGGEDDDVELEVLLGRSYSRGRDLLDWRAAQVDEMDVFCGCRSGSSWYR